MTTKDEKEAQIKLIYDKVLEAIPMDVCMINVVIALTDLANDFAIEIGCACEKDNDDNDEDNISPIGNIPGTSFSKN